MSNVPKSKRKKHDFETTRQMTQLRRDITEIAINDFGFDADRYQKMIDRYAAVRKDQPNVEVTVAKMQYKRQRKNIIALYQNLFDGRNPKWKK